MQTLPDNNQFTLSSEKNIQIREHILIKFLSQFTNLTDEESATILEELNVRSFKKGTVLLREGQIPKLSYFVLKGYVRQYIIVNGEEKTTDFFTEGQPVSVQEGLNKQGSKYFLVCGEEAVMTVGRISDYEEEEFQINPKFEKVCRLIAEQKSYNYKELLELYMVNSPEERYLNFIRVRPDLADRVPQYQIASFLGIKPESLSRIRKRIKNKGI
jgi:CRP-like cAMP-binding protein